MANLPAIVLGDTLSEQKQVTSSDTTLVGAGIDASASGALTLGAATATSIALGQNTTLADNIPLSFGTGSDFTIVHDGVDTTATGDILFNDSVTLGSDITDTVTVTSRIDSSLVFKESVSLRALNAEDTTTADTAGTRIDIWAGKAADATSATAGNKLGGNLNLTSGGGADGDVTYVAGAGGTLNIWAGWAGSDGGAGGANGGGVNIDGGAATGSGLDGRVTIGAGDTRYVQLASDFKFFPAGDFQLSDDSGTNGQVLTSAGAAAAPTWEDAAGGSLSDAYDAGRTITAATGPIVYNFGTTAGGALDVNITGDANVLADTAAVIDVTYGAGAYTGGAASLNVDWSGMTSLTKAADVHGVFLTGKTNAGSGSSIGLRISGFDSSIVAESAVFVKADNAAFSIGEGGDLSIVHDATNTIATTKTGDFILDNTLATGSTIMRLGTTTNATSFEIQSDTPATLFGFLGSGDLQVGGSSGTSGQVLTSGGADAAPTWATPAASAVVYVATTEVGSPTNGMAVYFSDDNEVTKTDSDALVSSRFIGVRTGALTYRVGGEVSIQLIGSLTVAAGEQIFLSATAGLCTNIAPTSGYAAEIGIVSDASAYAGSSGETVEMVIQPKAVVTRS